MSYTSIGSTDCSFVTQEQGMVFMIRMNEELNEANIAEVIQRASRVPYDAWVVRSGIEIRNSLTSKQKQDVLERIAQLTLRDFDYCKDEEIVLLSDHVLLDYLLASPDVLESRGWASKEPDLLTQVTRTLIHSEVVEKAMVHFRKNGVSKLSLTYTSVGDDEGSARKLSIAFHQQSVLPFEKVFVVTVLRSH
jgi:hypothetical protein